MSALGMKVDDIKALAVNQSAQPRGCAEIKIVTDRKRLNPYIELPATGVQQSVRIG